MTATLDSSQGSWDSDGFTLWLRNDEGDEFSVRVTDVAAARGLVACVGQLDGWIADHDRERAAYLAATPEERREVIGATTGGNDG